MLRIETRPNQFLVQELSTLDLRATISYGQAVAVQQPLDVGLLEHCLTLHRLQCSPVELEYLDAIEALDRRAHHPLLESIEFQAGQGRLPTLEYTVCNKLTDSSVTVVMRLPGMATKLL